MIKLPMITIRSTLCYKYTARSVHCFISTLRYTYKALEVHCDISTLRYCNISTLRYKYTALEVHCDISTLRQAILPFSICDSEMSKETIEKAKEKKSAASKKAGDLESMMKVNVILTLIHCASCFYIYLLFERNYFC